MEVNIDLSGVEHLLNVDTYKHCMSAVIKDVTVEAEGLCKAECPVDTGYLMNSHSTEIEDMRGTVVNSADYVEYVIYGHRSSPGNDYPQRALSTLESQISLIVDSNIKDLGVT